MSTKHFCDQCGKEAALGSIAKHGWRHLRFYEDEFKVRREFCSWDCVIAFAEKEKAADEESAKVRAKLGVWR